MDGNSSGRFFRDYLDGRVTEDGLGILYKVSGIGDDKFPYRYFTGPKKAGATKGKYYQGVPLAQLENADTKKTSPIENFYDLAGSFGNCRSEGGVDFRGGKKPEALLEIILKHFSNPGDLILDSFGGSGSTAAAAHKMGRRWIPYGKRTGVPAVDRLTIVAHDRFDDIIAEANDKKSIIRTGIVIGKDIDFKPKKPLEIRSNLDAMITGQPAADMPEDFFEKPTVPSDAQKPQEQTPLFREDEKEVAHATLEVIKEFERLPSSRQLQDKSVQQEMVKLIEEKIKPKQAQLEGIIKAPNVEDVVRKVTQAYTEYRPSLPQTVPYIFIYRMYHHLVLAIVFPEVVNISRGWQVP